jgi:hypothetical protein
LRRGARHRGLRARRRAAPALLVFGVLAAVHVAANATARYRVPWLPLLAVYAAPALLAGRELPRRMGRAGVVGAALAIAFLLGVGLPYYLVYGGR